MNFIKINGDIFLTDTIARIINRVDQGSGMKYMVVVLHEKNNHIIVIITLIFVILTNMLL